MGFTAMSVLLIGVAECRLERLQRSRKVQRVNAPALAKDLTAACQDDLDQLRSPSPLCCAFTLEARAMSGRSFLSLKMTVPVTMPEASRIGRIKLYYERHERRVDIAFFIG